MGGRNTSKTVNGKLSAEEETREDKSEELKDSELHIILQDLVTDYLDKNFEKIVKFKNFYSPLDDAEERDAMNMENIAASVENLRKEHREDFKELSAKLDEQRKESAEDSLRIGEKLDGYISKHDSEHHAVLDKLGSIDNKLGININETANVVSSIKKIEDNIEKKAQKSQAWTMTVLSILSLAILIYSTFLK